MNNKVTKEEVEAIRSEYKEVMKNPNQSISLVVWTMKVAPLLRYIEELETK